jgi:hypothetical protein
MEPTQQHLLVEGNAVDTDEELRPWPSHPGDSRPQTPKLPRGDRRGGEDRGRECPTGVLSPWESLHEVIYHPLIVKKDVVCVGRIHV